MSVEATFHEGYRRALEDVTKLVTELRDGHITELADLLEELDERIERARCFSRSALAADASSSAGY